MSNDWQLREKTLKEIQNDTLDISKHVRLFFKQPKT